MPASKRAVKGARTSARSTLEQLYVPDRAAWRRWLGRHHAKSPGVWLVFDRATHRKDRLPYGDAVEEALCVGWIDSTVRPLSDTQYCQLFTPRKPRSTWSKLNKTRVARLEAAGLMRPAGLAAVSLARANGSWTSLDQVEALTVTPELAEALARTEGADAGFASLSPSARKGYLHWISQAKRAETRARRIAEVVKRAVDRKRSRFAP